MMIPNFALPISDPPANEGERCWGAGGPWHPITFSEIVLCQEYFPGNLLLCQSPRFPKYFWP